MPRIMTWQVREALAEAAAYEPPPAPPPKPGSALAPNKPSASSVEEEEDVPDGVLLPCAPPVSSSIDGAVDSKKRKRSSEDPEDGTKVTAPQLTWDKANIPEDLKKYWHQRHRLFSLFDSGVQLDRESWYSVTPEKVAQQIAERCRCDTIVDAFCGAGGNAIQFAMTCRKVIAIDIDPVKIQIARHNAALYEVDDTIEFVCADFVEWARKQKRGSVDVIFLSPPWGGVDYLHQPHPTTLQITAPSYPGSYPLSSLGPLPGTDLFRLARSITPDVAMYLPRNVDLHEVSRLAAPEEVVEVEEEWMGRGCKAVTALFGGLVGEEEG